MNKTFDINDLIQHEHAWFMDIDSRSMANYIVSCSVCGINIFIGWWSGRTGHRYCVENNHFHFNTNSLVKAIAFSSQNLPVPGI